MIKRGAVLRRAAPVPPPPRRRTGAFGAARMLPACRHGPGTVAAARLFSGPPRWSWCARSRAQSAARAGGGGVLRQRTRAARGLRQSPAPRPRPAVAHRARSCLSPASRLLTSHRSHPLRYHYSLLSRTYRIVGTRTRSTGRTRSVALSDAQCCAFTPSPQQLYTKIPSCRPRLRPRGVKN
ncbi:hypothetical protein RR46_02388 [Papilio xuthus]|uniref:Uncharacterized protein n=1 Tax=Papilio xuthus TaxID=66420 RepID=A0A194Q0U3_PAPXU|nr:hypothetical protein RR46_02388 [Papilio xuthus]